MIFLLVYFLPAILGIIVFLYLERNHTTKYLYLRIRQQLGLDPKQHIYRKVGREKYRCIRCGQKCYSICKPRVFESIPVETTYCKRRD